VKPDLRLPDASPLGNEVLVRIERRWELDHPDAAALRQSSRMQVLAGGRSQRYRPWFRDKGHQRMYHAFRRAVAAGERPTYCDDSLRRSSEIFLEIRDIVLDAAAR